MLDLNELDNGMPAITPYYGKILAEAGGVCLESQGHIQGHKISIQGDYSNSYSLKWPPVTDQAKLCWADPQVATEHGAVGIAVLLAKKEVGFSVIERSRKGTGFDYWLGDEDDVPFQNKARLEISGIRTGDAKTLTARVKQKIKQTDPSDGVLPAYILIITDLGETDKATEWLFYRCNTDKSCSSFK